MTTNIICDSFGQITIKGADVMIYSVGDAYEIDIITEDGAFGFDVPRRDVKGDGDLLGVVRRGIDSTADLQVIR